ncbi:MAG: tetratricopeptide repeat protein, partial [Spirochaetota bacterium]
MDDVFVGRQEQLKDFRKYLQRVVAKPGLWQRLRGKGKAAEDPKKIIHLFGEGGLGKTTLLDKFLAEVDSLSAKERDRLVVISLDWEVYYRRMSDLPDSPQKVMQAIYRKFCDLGFTKKFSEYDKLCKQLYDLGKTVEEKRLEWRSRVEGGVNIVGTGLQATGKLDPHFAVAQKAFSTAKDLTKKIAGGMAETLEEFLRQSLEKQDFELYSQPDLKLCQALLTGIVASSSHLLFAFDTFEYIDASAVEQWFREVFLKDLYAHKDCQVVTVIAGRNDPRRNYRNTFLDSLLEFQDMEDILFSDRETGFLVLKHNLSLTDSQIKSLTQHTHGIPMVVRECLRLLLEEKVTADELLADLQVKKGSFTAVIEEMVQRYLRYCEKDEEEMFKIFHLAMLRNLEGKVLEVLWQMDALEVSREIDRLAEKHSFVISSRDNLLHGVVKEFLRRHLIQGMQASSQFSHREIVRQAAGKLATYYKAKVQELETKVVDIEQRYEDENYRGTMLSYLSAMTFCKPYELFTIVNDYLLETLEFQQDFAGVIVNQLEEFRNVYTTPQKKALSTLQKGITAFEPLTPDNFEKEPKQEVVELLQYFEKHRTELREVAKKLLDYRQAELMMWRKQFRQALEKLEILNIFLQQFPSKKDRFLNKLYDYEQRVEPQLTLKDTELFIQVNPKNYKPYFTYSDLQDHEKAIEDYTKAIDINPEDVDAYCNRGIAHYYLKDYEKAMEDYTKAIDIFCIVFNRFLMIL